MWPSPAATHRRAAEFGVLHPAPAPEGSAPPAAHAFCSGFFGKQSTAPAFEAPCRRPRIISSSDSGTSL